ncbi:hypothetical protein GCM10009107_01950 [Ideonella azotifigens]|uniref:Uncharacterized protein n=1 Tax=Ideonella azotifigens TaxID=513160 RepID=A0ABN1JJK6_9BURK
MSKAAQSPVDLSTAICTGSPDVIDSYCKAKCEVDPLKPISDADAIAFENGATVQEDNLTDATKAALACLRAAASAAGGQLVVTSAYRPQAYQDHL